MTVGLAALALMPRNAPIWVLASLMVLVGLGGPTISPPLTAALLHSTPAHLAGTSSGVLNTSRQLGGALAVAVFGALLAEPETFTTGMRTTLLMAAAAAALTTAATPFLRTHTNHPATPRLALPLAVAAPPGGRPRLKEATATTVTTTTLPATRNQAAPRRRVLERADGAS